MSYSRDRNLCIFLDLWHLGPVLHDLWLRLFPDYTKLIFLRFLWQLRFRGMSLTEITFPSCSRGGTPPCCWASLHSVVVEYSTHRHAIYASDAEGNGIESHGILGLFSQFLYLALDINTVVISIVVIAIFLFNILQTLYVFPCSQIVGNISLPSVMH